MTKRPPGRPMIVGLALLLPVLIVLGVWLHRLGAGGDWKIVDRIESDGFQESIDSARLSADGKWLLWTDANRGWISALNLETPGPTTVTFGTRAPLSIRPIGVMENHLLLLRSAADPGWVRTVAIGIERLLGFRIGPGGGSADSLRPGGRWTTHLEAIRLDTGKAAFRFRGGTGALEGADPFPSDFEMGRAAIAPDGQSAAWWWGEEQVQDTPISATVTETIELFAWRQGLQSIARRQIVSPGYFETWSGLLNFIGDPMWMTSGACFFLSFLDGGSLVPLDPRSGEFAATLTLIALFENSAIEPPLPFEPPEGVVAFRGEDPTGDGFLFWSRDGGSLRFTRFTEDFKFVSTLQHDAGSLDLTDPTWLSGGDLLARERGGKGFVVISGLDGKTQTIPPPPSADAAFRILGRDVEGRLVALYDSKFWTSKAGEEGWSELPIAW